MKRGLVFAFGAAALILCRLCAAGPADYVYTPAVEYGEREIDFKAGRANTHDADQQSAVFDRFRLRRDAALVHRVLFQVREHRRGRHALRCLGMGEQVPADGDRTVSGRRRPRG